MDQLPERELFSNPGWCGIMPVKQGGALMVKVGDWVTQYSAGYWKVLAVLPKYADEDYSYNGKAWKKGDRLGDWVIMKKGFTAKMKPANGCEYADAQWCSPVSEEIRQSIETAFAENPKAKQKFDKAPDRPVPSVASIWLRLTDEQAASLSTLLQELSDRFSEEQFWAKADGYRSQVVDPASTTHVLYLFSYPWEMSESCDLLHFGPVLKKYES